jgi:hypothetical protein
MTTQELSAVMLTQQSSPLLQNIIGLLLDASCNHKDVLVRKVSPQLCCPHSHIRGIGLHCHSDKSYDLHFLASDTGFYFGVLL